MVSRLNSNDMVGVSGDCFDCNPPDVGAAADDSGNLNSCSGLVLDYLQRILNDRQEIH